MSMGAQILFFAGALGAFNGLVLGCYLLFNKKTTSAAAFFLGILLLMISIRVGKSVLYYFHPQLPKIYLQVGLSACFLIGPSLYWFFKTMGQPGLALSPAVKWHWGLLLAVLLAGGMALPYASYPRVWNQVIVYIIYLQWLVYLVATGFLLKDTLLQFFRSPRQRTKAEKFRLWMYAGNIVVFTVYLLSLLKLWGGLYIAGAICFSFILYLTLFLYIQGHNFPVLLQAGDELQPAKPVKRKITDAAAFAWKEKLDKAIASNELYKNPNLKLHQLAQQVNIPAHQLSQLLNENLGKSFSTYINEYRINEACKLIGTQQRLSLEAIGYEVGYNSKSTFYTAFKKIKNTTPALFKETLEKVAAQQST